MQFLGILLFLVHEFSFGRTAPIADVFERYEIVPNVLSTAPKQELILTFGELIHKTGNILEREDVADVPSLSFVAEEDKLYTLLEIDIDPPDGIFLHWMIVNMQGVDVSSGQEIQPYLPSHPPEEEGFHRYVYLVYEQTKQIYISGTVERMHFPFYHFLEDHELGLLIAGSFHQTRTV